jgi:hypothetical protein
MLPGSGDRTFRELTDFSDAAWWYWDGAYQTGVLYTFKGGTLGPNIAVAGLREDAAFAGAKKLAAKALGGEAKTGHVYAGSPAEKQYATSIELISREVLGTGAGAASDSQIAALQQQSQRVVRCTYGPLKQAQSFYYWYRTPPDNLGFLLSHVSPNPLVALGRAAVTACPGSLELAQHRTEAGVGQRSRRFSRVAHAIPIGARLGIGRPTSSWTSSTTVAPRSCRLTTSLFSRD